MANKTEGGLLSELQPYLLMVAVKKALAAAAGANNNIKHLVDMLDKVELKTEKDVSIMAVRLTLKLWWDLNDGEFHVSTKTKVIEEGMYIDHLSVLEDLISFEPEDLLKFAAYL